MLTFSLSNIDLSMNEPGSCRDDNIASKSSFFSNIRESSSTLLKGGPPWPARPFIGSGMGWGMVGTDPGGPDPPADIMAAAMFCVLGENDRGKLVGLKTLWFGRGCPWC